MCCWCGSRLNAALQHPSHVLVCASESFETELPTASEFMTSVGVGSNAVSSGWAQRPGHGEAGQVLGRVSHVLSTPEKSHVTLLGVRSCELQRMRDYFISTLIFKVPSSPDGSVTPLGITCWNCSDCRGWGLKSQRFFFCTENVPLAWPSVQMIISLLATSVEHRRTLAYPNVVCQAFSS